MRFQDMNELLGITPTPVLEPLTYRRLFIGYLFLNERNSLIDLFLFNLSLGFILLRYKIFSFRYGEIAVLFLESANHEIEKLGQRVYELEDELNLI